MAPAVERREHSRKSSHSQSRSPARTRGSPPHARKSSARKEESPSLPRRSSPRKRSPARVVPERARSPKHARLQPRSPSPPRNEKSQSPSPRTKRLWRAQAEREERERGRHRERERVEGREAFRGRRAERDDGRDAQRKVDLDDGRDRSRERRADRDEETDASRVRRMGRDDGRDASRARRADFDDGRAVSRERRVDRSDGRDVSRDRRADVDDARDALREKRLDRDDGRDTSRDRITDWEKSDGGSGRSSRHDRSISPEGHRHRGRNGSHSSPRASRTAHVEDANSRRALVSRASDQDAVAQMNAAAEALEAKEKQKPSFELSGKLADETNRVRGITLLHTEPPEAHKPDIRWRLYVFKAGEVLNEPLYVHRMSCYLFGRERKVADIPTDHPSCSKQHAVLQYRLVEKERPDGMMSKQVRPYLMDLDSTNGTFINDNRIESRRYYELFEKDTIKFGNSSREYVLLHENSTA